PLVQLAPRGRLHGGRRGAPARRRARRRRRDDEAGDAARDRRGRLRPRGAFRDRAGRLVPDDGEARLSHGSSSPSLRARRLARVAGDRPLLDPLDPVRGAGTLDVEAAMSGTAASSAVLPPKVAVVGFARSGRAPTQALLERGVGVTVVDDRPRNAFEEVPELERAGVRFYFGRAPEEALD